MSRLQERFGGHLPSPRELLAADPQVLRASGMSNREGATLRELAERWRPYRSLAVSYLFASEYE